MTRRFRFSVGAVLVVAAIIAATASAVAVWLAIYRNGQNVGATFPPNPAWRIDSGAKPAASPGAKPPKSVFRDLQFVPLADDDEKPVMTVPEKWPFADPPNMAAITVRQVIEDGEPILYVTHDADDGGWQFLTGGDVSTDDAMVVSLEEMLKHDPTLAELANLEPGWTAARGDVGSPWHRSRR